ncbi:polymorphic toxin type 44 domain-containing protein [Microcoleus sp. D2_18a_B4]|uniref:polymorphic toxin type 44 domain-containing protein n=1 Tax=Microcoleus sp. D2_18a_B4 TaxID=3055329 RepID=UPI002FD763E9
MIAQIINCPIMFELSKVFDAAYYSKMNPDLQAAGLINPEQLLNQFRQFGVNEARSFSPYVDLNFYVVVNPDLAAIGLKNPQQLLDHLITYGINEKRLFSPKVDLNFYAAANPDLRTAGLTTGEQLFDHLINYGEKEGRQLVSPVSSPSQGTPANTGLSQQPNIRQIPIPNIPRIPVPNVPSFKFADFVASSDASNKRSSSSLEPDINGILSTGLQTAIGQLKKFVTAPTFSEKMTIAFGEKLDLESATSLIHKLSNSQSLPPIEIISAKDIKGYKGAFDLLTNTVYISEDFLLPNANNPDAIASVILEEIGHSIDSRVNAIDALGDEGEIFSALVRGTTLSQPDILALKSENDQVTITPNGKPILVETSASAWTTGVWDWNWNKVGDTTLSKRNDGLNGVNVDWGTGSVAAGRSDYFIAGMWNDSYFDANKTYKFRVKADDGFYLLVSRDGENWNSFMNEWEFAYNNNDNYKTFKEYSFTPNTSGYYYVWAYVFEKDGAASFDFSWDNGWDKNRGGLNYADGDTTIQYMYQEMKNNASSNDVKDIKNLKEQWWNSNSQGRAYGLWRNKVSDGQEWDHKPKLNSMLNLQGSNDYAYPVWGDSASEFYYDIWSNIHYGYVGKAAGFSDLELQSFATLNDVGKLNLNFKDTNAIKLGIDLWNETGGNPNNLTPERLRQKVISKASELNIFNIKNGA